MLQEEILGADSAYCWVEIVRINEHKKVGSPTKNLGIIFKIEEEECKVILTR